MRIVNILDPRYKTWKSTIFLWICFIATQQLEIQWMLEINKIFVYAVLLINKKYAKHNLHTFAQLLKSTLEYSRKARKTRKLNKKKCIIIIKVLIKRKTLINAYILWRKSLKLINALAKFTQTWKKSFNFKNKFHKTIKTEACKAKKAMRIYNKISTGQSNYYSSY